MINLTGWSLFVDIALTCSLVYLAYRLTKAESVAVKIDRVGDLEKSLHKIIKESQEASYELEDKLRSRQRELSLLLSDLRDVEERVTGNFQKSTSIKLALDKDLEAGERLIEKINSILKLGKVSVSDDAQNVSYNSKEIESEVSNDVKDEEIVAPLELTNELTDELKNDLEYEIDNPRKKVSIKKEKHYVVSEKYARNDIRPSSATSATSSLTNSLKSSSPLANKIEKEVIRESQKGQREETRGTLQNKEIIASQETAKEKALKAKNLEHSYDLAEAMIKRGMELEEVALKTNLSLNDVRKIAKIALMNGGYTSQERGRNASSLKIEKESIDNRRILTSADDERLGVLSKMRRSQVTL